MTYADYLVLTVPDGDALASSTFARLSGVVPAMHLSGTLYGAYGWRHGKVFVGTYHDGRLLVSVTGAAAHNAALKLREMMRVDNRAWSVARLDLQQTHAVSDADALVRATVPVARYRSSLITPINGVGATLYVGAAKSDRRLRIYNKTAESGVEAPDGGDLLRVEVVLRNRLADAALRMFSAAGDVFYSHVKQMLARCSVLDLISGAGTQVLVPYIDESEDWLERRLRWLDSCVLPALRKIQARGEVDVIDYIARNLSDAGAIGDG